MKKETFIRHKTFVEQQNITAHRKDLAKDPNTLFTNARLHWNGTTDRVVDVTQHNFAVVIGNTQEKTYISVIQDNMSYPDADILCKELQQTVYGDSLYDYLLLSQRDLEETYAVPVAVEATTPKELLFRFANGL